MEIQPSHPRSLRLLIERQGQGDAEVLQRGSPRLDTHRQGGRVRTARLPFRLATEPVIVCVVRLSLVQLDYTWEEGEVPDLQAELGGQVGEEGESGDRRLTRVRGVGSHHGKSPR